MKYRSYVVFGLGKFGQAVVDQLVKSDADVMVVDNDEETIEQYASKVSMAITADLTDADSIEALGISNVDCAIVAMGMSLEASIMCVMMAKECGIKHVVAKAGSKRMGLVLEKVGADQVVYPEEESGFRTARRLLSSNFLEYFEVNDDFCIIEMRPKHDWIGHSLLNLGLRQKYDLNVISINNDSAKGSVKGGVDPEEVLRDSHTLLVLVPKKNLSKLSS